MTPQPPIHFHIERLVVDESLVLSAQSGALQAAVEKELSRLFAERGIARSSDSAMPALNAGSIHVAGGSRPAQFGRQIAQSIHTALNPSNPAAIDRNPASTRS